MELINFLNLLDSRFSISGSFIMFKKYENIPILYKEDGVFYVFLDAKVPKIILKITSILVDLDLKFYFTTPELSNPKGIDSDIINSKIIKHYLISYINKDFFYGFRKIEFDIIRNMVKWSSDNNCFNLVKDEYISVLKTVNSKSYNYYKNSYEYLFSKEIIEDFRTLYRDIQINKIL